MRNFLMPLIVCLTLTGCVRNARLYPANDLSITTGVLEATFMSYGSGHGSIEITMPDSEILKGEYSLIRGGSMQFGNVYGSVYSNTGSATFNGNGTSYEVPGGSPGTASMFGNKGTSMLCEFYNDNFSGHGNGGCKSSKGGLYRIQY